MKKLVFLTGAGISAESGLATFRGQDGLWEKHRIEEVASPQAWARDPALVLRFYNQRRRQVLLAEPNAAHRAIQQAEERFDVTVITQNVDDLHERAGSKNILHLHGEIRRARSTLDPRWITQIDGSELELGDLCPLGSQLRPHIVWFGEAVPLLDQAISLVRSADILIVVGTSLRVYPAASLIGYARPKCQIFYIDPTEQAPQISDRHVVHLQATACMGLPSLLQDLFRHAAV